ncbi:MAG: hypothetical protein R3A79_31005 [Nannocystaceae bacterium]
MLRWIGAALVAGVAGMAEVAGPGAAAGKEPVAASLRCPASRYGPREGRRVDAQVDVRGVVLRALGAQPRALVEVGALDTPAVPGLVGLAYGAASDADGWRAAIVPIRWCDAGACVGDPQRFVGARRIRPLALVDLTGVDGEVAIPEDGEATAPGPWELRGCPRWPAVIVEVEDGPELGSDRLLTILALVGATPRAVHSERSHRGREGGSEVEVLIFSGTRGGSPSDLGVRRRRTSAGLRPRVELEVALYNFIDGRYRGAP